MAWWIAMWVLCLLVGWISGWMCGYLVGTVHARWVDIEPGDSLHDKPPLEYRIYK
jgi:hypothetical protein